MSWFSDIQIETHAKRWADVGKVSNTKGNVGSMCHISAF